MKVFYTNLSKCSDMASKGIKFLIAAAICFVLMVVTGVIMGLQEVGTTEIWVCFIVFLVLIACVLIFCTVGFILTRKKIFGEDDSRFFIVDDDKKLYMIDGSNIISDHFSLSRFGRLDGNDPLDIIFAVVGMMGLKKEVQENIKKTRDYKTALAYMNSENKARIISVKIISSSTRAMNISVTNEDGNVRNVLISNNYYNYEELFWRIKEIANTNGNNSETHTGNLMSYSDEQCRVFLEPYRVIITFNIIYAVICFGVAIVFHNWFIAIQETSRMFLVIVLLESIIVTPCLLIVSAIIKLNSKRQIQCIKNGCLHIQKLESTILNDVVHRTYKVIKVERFISSKRYVTIYGDIDVVTIYQDAPNNQKKVFKLRIRRVFSNYQEMSTLLSSTAYCCR